MNKNNRPAQPHPDLLRDAEVAYASGNLDAAAELAAQVLRRDRFHYGANRLAGMIAGARANYGDAARHLTAAANARQATPDVWYYLGTAHQRNGSQKEAVLAFRRALKAHGDFFEALHDLGCSLAMSGRDREAVESFDKALALRPDSWEALTNKGRSLARLGRQEEEYECYRRALAYGPAERQILTNLGAVAADLGRPDEVEQWFSRAVAMYPDVPEVFNLHGAALDKLNRHSEALACYDKALALQPEYAEAWMNRGTTLGALRRYPEALAAYDRVLALNPRLCASWHAKGVLLNNLKDFDGALQCFERALEIDPHYLDALSARGRTLNNAKRFDEAAACFTRLLELAPDYEFARGRLLYAQLFGCDWTRLPQLGKAIRADLAARRRSADPFVYQAFSESPTDLQACAEIYADAVYPALPPLASTARSGADKIRIGYLSGEFRSQATSILMVGLLEAHDKRQFEVFAFDNGWSDGSPIRQRIESAVDQVVDIAHLGDREAAQLIAEKGIDILVNLNGYFGESRQGIFSRRPAPLQVNYLGFPGTIGAPYIDYIIADRCVIPPDERHAYTEKAVYLPHTYQPNDAKRTMAAAVPPRAALGLPDDGFVFCCFNNSYKITPQVFDVWMRLLARVPGSVLWLLEDNRIARDRLQREAEKRGIARERLIFAARATHDEHVARHQAADLFLDTLPYNAHTTASDALWSGLPLLTCTGKTFPGRVGTSLLHAIGLPELVTASLGEYEARALELAGDPALLKTLRARLAANRPSMPLFDTALYARHFEQALQRMWERCRQGMGPEDIDVAD